jgi:hypothetical protein
MNKWPMILIFFGTFIANAQNIADFKWKKRLLILVANSVEDTSLKQQLRAFTSEGSHIKERDLVLILMDKNHIYFDNGQISQLSLPETYRVLQLEKDFTGLVLVGKDGGVKLKTPFPVLPNKVFDLIDAMPMRKSELKNRK